MKIDMSRVRRHIRTLAGFTATPGAGTTRLSYTPMYRRALDYLSAYGQSLGLDTRLDAIGNMRMRLPGMEAGAPAVVIGSHIDSVINGGDLDGVLGVVSGLEVVEVMVENGLRPRYPVEVISFVEEEGTTFQCPLTGSKVLTGALGLDDLENLKDRDGNGILQAAEAFGLSIRDLRADRLSAGSILAMYELHIEQGAVLESLGLPVGIVEVIAGSENHRVRLKGRANHAGTTPMHLRLDALACAAECISAVERIASSDARPDTVATVGYLRCLPNAPNVIPSVVEFSIDVRDIRQPSIEAAAGAILEEIRSIASSRHIECEHQLTGASPPCPLSSGITKRLVRLAGAAGISYHRMNSGALHDAAMLTKITDVGMIFVPSKDGRSHTPREWTDDADIEPGVQLLLSAVIEHSA